MYGWTSGMCTLYIWRVRRWTMKLKVLCIQVHILNIALMRIAYTKYVTYRFIPIYVCVFILFELDGDLFARDFHTHTTYILLCRTFGFLLGLFDGLMLRADMQKYLNEAPMRAGWCQVDMRSHIWRVKWVHIVISVRYNVDNGVL